MWVGRERLLLTNHWYEPLTKPNACTQREDSLNLKMITFIILISSSFSKYMRLSVTEMPGYLMKLRECACVLVCVPVASRHLQSVSGRSSVMSHEACCSVSRNHSLTCSWKSSWCQSRQWRAADEFWKCASDKTALVSKKCEEAFNGLA